MLLFLWYTVLSSFHRQGYRSTSLAKASAYGHSEIVALLLQTKGIDVNHGVSITILTPSHVAFSP